MPPPDERVEIEATTAVGPDDEGIELVAAASAVDAASISEPWSVYLLECRGGTSYIGISPRPDDRYAAHQAGRGGAFTRANPPVRCVKVVWFENRSAAASLEPRLKALSRRQKRRWFVEFPVTTPRQPASLAAGLGRLPAKNRALSTTCPEASDTHFTG